MDSVQDFVARGGVIQLCKSVEAPDQFVRPKGVLMTFPSSRAICSGVEFALKAFSTPDDSISRDEEATVFELSALLYDSVCTM